MARQVLENGVILPAEYSDDWYDDMTSNLTKLDDVIGSDSEKLSSSDVGAAALSNNYNDLDNLPTIPTVNDATLTIQKNGSTVKTFTANASSNVTCNITVPTKTSDLTNDSDFVDTSNAAVSSGITSAKVSDYDTHIADTDIHVTTADKNRWNNNTYVFRYSSTALVASSTNSNALLDNIDNLKVGDKVIDSSGVLFSITAIDTQNSTFTIGTALLDLAQDSDVVHKSGNETISGYKTFSYNVTLYNSSASVSPIALFFKNKKVVMGSTTDIGSQNIAFRDSADTNLSILKTACESVGNTSLEISVYNKDSNNQTVSGGMLISQTPANTYITPTTDNAVLFGSTSRRWSKIYGTEYYYGSNNVEFSTKFVTTDTAQTITGNKTFSSNVNVYNSDSSTDTANIILKNSKAERGSTTNVGEQNIFFLDKDNAQIGNIKCEVDANGYSSLTLQCSDINDLSSGVQVRKTPTGFAFRPINDNQSALGQGGRRWYNTFTSRINSVEPSSLSLPSYSSSRIDISSYITNLTGGNGNEYTVPANGYIFVRTANGTYINLVEYPSGACSSVCSQTADDIGTFLPVIAGRKCIILIKCSSVDRAYFIPCQGNV